MSVPARIGFVLAIVWLTTARHEAAHALAAAALGRDLVEVRLWPGYRPDVGPFLGYVRYEGEASPWITGAPYLAATVWLAGSLLALRLAATGRRARLALVGFGAASALGDLAYNYARSWREGTDVRRLLEMLPPVAVHLGFLAVLAAGFLALATVARDGGARGAGV